MSAMYEFSKELFKISAMDAGCLWLGQEEFVVWLPDDVIYKKHNEDEYGAIYKLDADDIRIWADAQMRYKIVRLPE